MKTAKLSKNNRLTQSIAPAPIVTRLDLGSGNNKRQGFLGVDSIKFPNVDLVHDLRQPWPWADNSIEEAHSSHFLEHLERLERVHFFNELYRVLKPDAKATIITPHWSSCRAYGDPTHKWPPMGEFAWFYLTAAWREANAPHTDARWAPGMFNCNFSVTWGYSLEPGTALRNQEYQQYAMQYLLEARQDMIATLVKK